MDKKLAEFTALQVVDAVIDECYLAARGTPNLMNPRYTRNQMYWKGRADAANDVRKLKVTPRTPQAKEPA